MVAFSTLSLPLFASVAVNAFALPLQRRAVIAHDAVVGFPQTVTNDAAGATALKYKPWLKVENGCVPYPAVDAAGNTSGGLKTSGSPSSGCSSSVGQVYSRSEWYNGRWAVMYSWYMPKDSPSAGLGHRHDWEGIVVWLTSNDPNNQQILALSTSAHGAFDTVQTPNVPLDGNRSKVRYYSIWPVDHQLGTTSDKGGEQPLIDWDSLTQAARDALTNTDFGSANVLIKDANFEANLAKANF